MRNPNYRIAIVCLAWWTSSALIGRAAGANLTSNASQGSGSHWNQNVWVTNAPGAYDNTTPLVGPPVAGNTYELVQANRVALAFSGAGNARLRNPTASGTSQTFAGDSLTLYTNCEIRFKNVSGVPSTNTPANFPGVGGNPGLILDGGFLDDGDNEVCYILGSVLVEDGSVSVLGPGADLGNPPVALTVTGRTFVMGAVMSGNGTLAVALTPTNSPILVTNGLNTFNGNWLIQEGWLIGTTPQCLGSASITVDPMATIPSYPDLPLQTRYMMGSGTTTNGAYAILDFDYAAVCTGTLILTNGGLMNLHTNCTFASLIIEGNSLGDGTYTYDYLTTHFTNFLANGSGSITIASPAAPPAPTGVTAITGDGQETITWLPAATASGYTVSRSNSHNGTYSPVGSTNGLMFTDTGLVNGQLYYYVVQATNSFGSSTNSSEVVGAPNARVLGVTVTTNLASIGLQWSSYSGATGYIVRRGTISGGPYSILASNVLVTSYSDSSIGSGTVYYYVIAATLTSGYSSALSAEAAALTYPAAPSIATDLYGTNGIWLKLSTPDSVSPSFSVQVSSDGLNFSPLATLGTGTNYYVDTGLAQGVKYYFNARAQNLSGMSGLSGTVNNMVPIGTISVSFGYGNPANPSPTPAGYLSDVAFPYGDRGNGFTYGWSTDSSDPSGTAFDMTGQARYNANNPADELRKQTFVLQTKNLTAPYPSWNMVIPNGLYKVRLVSGDQTATDSNYRQNVNGVDTTLFAPGGGNFYGQWTVECRVTNNLLTLTPSTNASNDKINFLDIYPGTLPTALFTLGPTNGSAPLTVNFTNNSAGDYDSGLWVFGDGGTSANTGGTVSYTYTNAGTYTVSLTLSNSVGDFSTRTVTNAVTVSSGGPVTMTLTRIGGGNLQLNWNGGQGQLLQATNLAGPWTTNTGFTLPLTVSPTNRQLFYRVRLP